jgi:hypothetical protein
MGRPYRLTHSASVQVEQLSQSGSLLSEIFMASSIKSRRYPRIGLPRGLYVAWQGPGDRMVSRVAMLGLGGLFIEAVDPPPVGENLRVYFEVPGGDVRARAVVRSSQRGKGMGVEFIAMGQEERARLYSLLQRLLGDPIGKPASQENSK